jgi:hypothetical protein
MRRAIGLSIAVYWTECERTEDDNRPEINRIEP